MPPERAALSGLAALAGGLFQTALAVANWPIDPYGPPRRAMGDLYLELARATGRVVASDRSTAGDRRKLHRGVQCAGGARHGAFARWRIVFDSCSARQNGSASACWLCAARASGWNAISTHQKHPRQSIDSSPGSIAGHIGHVRQCAHASGGPGAGEVVEPRRRPGLNASCGTAARAGIGESIRNGRRRSRRKMDVLAGQLRSAVDVMPVRASVAGFRHLLGKAAPQLRKLFRDHL